MRTAQDKPEYSDFQVYSARFRARVWTRVFGKRGLGLGSAGHRAWRGEPCSRLATQNRTRGTCSLVANGTWMDSVGVAVAVDSGVVGDG